MRSRAFSLVLKRTGLGKLYGLIPFLSSNLNRCFPYIVNLACKDVLAAIITLSRVEGGTTISKNPIEKLRILIKHVSMVCFIYDITPTNLQIRGSSLRRQHFASIVMKSKKKNSQLLRDIVTRWSYTHIMIERALDLKKVSGFILRNSDY